MADESDVRASSYEGSIAQLRGTLKWLVGAAGAVAAIIVAGLQLRNLPPSTHIVRFLIAIAAVAVALGVVLTLLVATSRALTVRRLSASDLSDRELKAGVIPGQILAGNVGDELVQSIVDHRTSLLAGAESVTALYMDSFARPQKLLKELGAGKVDVEWQGRTLSPTSSADRAELEAAMAAGAAKLATVEDAAHLICTEQAYRTLVGRHFVVGAMIFVVSVIAFAITTNESSTKPTITTPIKMRVVVLNKAASVLPSTCNVSELVGVAVGGTLADPVVDTLPAPGCPASRLTASSGLLLIPDPSS